MTTSYQSHYIECACHLFDHTIRFTIDDWEDDPNTNLIVETRMSHFLPWYRRIALAFKYVLGLDTTCQYSETIIPPETFPKLRALLDEAEALGQAKCDKLAKEILDQRKENGNE